MNAVDIESIPLFAQLSPEDRARIAAVSRAVHLDPGRVVVQEGEFAFDFYAIKTGEAAVRRGGKHVGSLEAGDIFGELGVVPDSARPWTRRRSASVVVIEPTEAIVIDGSDLRRLATELPALRAAISAAAAARRSAEASWEE